MTTNALNLSIENFIIELQLNVKNIKAVETVLSDVVFILVDCSFVKVTTYLLLILNNEEFFMNKNSQLFFLSINNQLI